MRELWPSPADDVDVAARYAGDRRGAPPGRPWVLVNMIASVDGATAVGGVSGPLAGPGDKAVFRAVRALPDLVLAGATTVRAEGYGPPRPSAEVRAARLARGQAAAPRLALVSASLDLDPNQRLFTEAEVPPLVFTAGDPRRPAVARMREAAEVVCLAGDRVDMAALLAHLGATGISVVLSEGGPSLNGQLVAAGVVDEWCATVAPLLAGGRSDRTAIGPATRRPAHLRLQRVLADDDYLFLRYATEG